MPLFVYLCMRGEDRTIRASGKSPFNMYTPSQGPRLIQWTPPTLSVSKGILFLLIQRNRLHVLPSRILHRKRKCSRIAVSTANSQQNMHYIYFRSPLCLILFFFFFFKQSNVLSVHVVDGMRRVEWINQGMREMRVFIPPVSDKIFSSALYCWAADLAAAWLLITDMRKIVFMVLILAGGGLNPHPPIPPSPHPPNPPCPSQS